VRSYRTCRRLFGHALRQPWLWVLAAALALAGPVYVLAPSTHNTDTTTLLPLISERATIEHFDTSYGGRAARDDAPMLLFRSPASEPAVHDPLVSVFSRYRISPVMSEGALFLYPYTGRGFSLSQVGFDATRGNLLSLHMLIAPLFAAILGMLALPDRRRLTALQMVSPLGRERTFLAITAGLAIQLMLLALIVAGALLPTLLLGETSGHVLAFVGQYACLLLLYTLPFAAAGLALSGLIRRSELGLLAGGALVLLILPAFSYLVQLLALRIPEWATESAVVRWLLGAIRFPSAMLFPSGVFALLVQLVGPGRVLGQTSVPALSIVSQLLQLALSTVLWILVAWAAFPRWRRSRS